MAELDEDGNCVLCGIPPEMCAHRPGLPKEEQANPHAFDARYEGHCSVCDRPILHEECN